MVDTLTFSRFQEYGIVDILTFASGEKLYRYRDIHHNCTYILYIQ
jgi:hypothetical protein